MTSALIIPKVKNCYKKEYNWLRFQVAAEGFFFNEKSKNKIQFIGMIFDTGSKREELFIDESSFISDV